MYLTNDGSDLGTKNIILNGTYGHGYFAGTVSWDTVKANTICLNNDPNSCRTQWPTGGTGSDIWSTWALGIAYYNSWNVGIGTDTPWYKLDVHGSIRANDAVLVTWSTGWWLYRWNSNYWGNYPYMTFWYSSLFLIGWSGAWGHNIYLVPNAADQSKGMVVTTGWNVGIGTSKPQSLLHIYGIDPTMTIDWDANWYQSIDFKDQDYGTTLAQIQNNSIDAEFSLRNKLNWPMIFWTSNTEKMRITAAGNVGIGTNWPTEDVQVKSYAQIGSHHTSCEAGSAETWGNFLRLIWLGKMVKCFAPNDKKETPNIQLNFTSFGGDPYNRMIDGGPNLNFGFTSGSAYDTKVTITNNGIVSIWDTTPTCWAANACWLNVQSRDIYSNGGDTSFINWDMWIWYDVGNSSTSWNLYVLNKIGIGTPTPTQALTVKWGIRLEGVAPYPSPGDSCTANERWTMKLIESTIGSFGHDYLIICKYFYGLYGMTTYNGLYWVEIATWNPLNP